jgi:hypothetical protein
MARLSAETPMTPDNNLIVLQRVSRNSTPQDGQPLDQAITDHDGHPYFFNLQSKPAAVLASSSTASRFGSVYNVESKGMSVTDVQSPIHETRLTILCRNDRSSTIYETSMVCG